MSLVRVGISKEHEGIKVELTFWLMIYLSGSLICCIGSLLAYGLPYCRPLYYLQSILNLQFSVIGICRGLSIFLLSDKISCSSFLHLNSSSNLFVASLLIWFDLFIVSRLVRCMNTDCIHYLIQVGGWVCCPGPRGQNILYKTLGFGVCVRLRMIYLLLSRSCTFDEQNKEMIMLSYWNLTWGEHQASFILLLIFISWSFLQALLTLSSLILTWHCLLRKCVNRKSCWNISLFLYSLRHNFLGCPN